MDFWDWLSMGGYGAYVWSAYGIAILMLISLGLYLWRKLQKARMSFEILKTLSTDPSEDIFT